MGVPDPIKNVLKSLERFAGSNVMLNLRKSRTSTWPPSKVRVSSSLAMTSFMIFLPCGAAPIAAFMQPGMHAARPTRT